MRNLPDVILHQAQVCHVPQKKGPHPKPMVYDVYANVVMGQDFAPLVKIKIGGK